MRHLSAKSWMSLASRAWGKLIARRKQVSLRTSASHIHDFIIIAAKAVQALAKWIVNKLKSVDLGSMAATQCGHSASLRNQAIIVASGFSTDNDRDPVTHRQKRLHSQQRA